MLYLKNNKNNSFIDKDIIKLKSLINYITKNIILKIELHDWNKDINFINLRKQGYIPSSKIYDINYKPKPMRLKVRPEVTERLTKLSIALINNCDFYINNSYLFEITVPFIFIASLINGVKYYKNGKKAYDAPLNALRILEELKYVIVYRSKNYKTHKYNPLRIWLTDSFFTSIGINLSKLKKLLYLFKQLVYKNNLKNFLELKFNEYYIKIKKLGIDISSCNFLQYELYNIKKKIILNNNKKNNIKIFKHNKKINDKNQKNVLNLEFKKNYFRNKYFYITTSNLYTPIEIILFEKKYENYYSKLFFINSELWFKFLLDKLKPYQYKFRDKFT